MQPQKFLNGNAELFTWLETAKEVLKVSLIKNPDAAAILNPDFDWKLCS